MWKLQQQAWSPVSKSFSICLHCVRCACILPSTSLGVCRTYYFLLYCCKLNSSGNAFIIEKNFYGFFLLLQLLPCSCSICCTARSGCWSTQGQSGHRSNKRGSKPCSFSSTGNFSCSGSHNGTWQGTAYLLITSHSDVQQEFSWDCRLSHYPLYLQVKRDSYALTTAQAAEIERLCAETADYHTICEVLHLDQISKTLEHGHSNLKTSIRCWDWLQGNPWRWLSLNLEMTFRFWPSYFLWKFTFSLSCCIQNQNLFNNFEVKFWACAGKG